MHGQELRTWRLHNGWTLIETARYLGTTKTTVHRWEKDRNAIPQSIDILVHLLHDKINIRRVHTFLYTSLD
mgnify:CR=1 FL=1